VEQPLTPYPVTFSHLG